MADRHVALDGREGPALQLRGLVVIPTALHFGSDLPITDTPAHATDAERGRDAAMDDCMMKPPDACRPSGVADLPNDRLAPAVTTPLRLAPDVSERVLARVGGDRTLLAEISRLFIDDAPGYLEGVRAALDASNGEALRRAAHTMKGAAANFDAEGVVAAARALETMGTTAQFDGRDPAWLALTDETDRLLHLLRALAA